MHKFEYLDDLILKYGLISYQNEDDDSKSSRGSFDDDEDNDDDKKDEKDEDDEEDNDDEKKEDDDKDDNEDKKDDDLKKDSKKQLSRVDFNELKKEFPELFKKHPTLRHAFFREQEFSERFSTVEEADEAIKAQEILDEMTSVVTNGDATRFLKDLRNENEKGFKEFSKNFLPALLEVDKDLFIEAFSPYVAQHIKNVHEKGKKIGGDRGKNLQNAAAIVRHALYGGDLEDIEGEIEGLLVKKEKSKEEVERDNEVKGRLTEKYQSLYSSVQESVFNILDKEIARGFEDIKDSKGLQRRAIKNVKDEVLETMNNDRKYIERVNALWKAEERNGFNGTKKDAIKTLFMAKARTIIPKIRGEVRKDLKLIDVKKDNEEKDVTRPDAGARSGGKNIGKVIEDAKKEKLDARQIFDR